MGLKTLTLVAALAALVVVGGIVAFAATRPDDFRIERSAVIEAPAARVYERIASPRQWESWSPWKARDPSLVSSFDGPESGAGASWTWTSHAGGSGRLTVTSATPTSGIAYKLVFFEFDTENTGDVALVETPAGTKATWTMTGKRRLIDKVIWLVFGMESSLGADFEGGLARLETLVEGGG